LIALLLQLCWSHSLLLLLPLLLVVVCWVH
jgi:hypothetical protein